MTRKTSKGLLLGVAAMVALAGCRSEDNNYYTVSRQYLELEFAYDRCLGFLKDERSAENFEKRLACTRAVYGGAE
ncbi:hypothetical protein [Paracoccus sp. ME4]|uniref:hypothetical protein n=1 Tax=Paracoccus sp. ME4 TaxID=3138066 RepID=UPI00398AE9BE